MCNIHLPPHTGGRTKYGGEKKEFRLDIKGAKILQIADEVLARYINDPFGNKSNS